jgi:hypothetical protein
MGANFKIKKNGTIALNRLGLCHELAIRQGQVNFATGRFCCYLASRMGKFLWISLEAVTQL